MAEPGFDEFIEAMELMDSLVELPTSDMHFQFHKVTTKLWVAGELGYLKAFERLAHIALCLGREMSPVAFPAMVRGFNAGLRTEMARHLADCFGSGACVEENSDVEKFLTGRKALTEDISRVLDKYGLVGYEELDVAAK